MNPSTRQHPLPGSPSSAREESVGLDWAGDRSRQLGLLQGAHPAADTLQEKRQEGGHVNEAWSASQSRAWLGPKTLHLKTGGPASPPLPVLKHSSIPSEELSCIFLHSSVLQQQDSFILSPLVGSKVKWEVAAVGKIILA